MNHIFKTLVLTFIPLLCGCLPETDNDLPDTYLQDDPRVVGSFRFKDEPPTTPAFSISKAPGGEKGKYIIEEKKPQEKTTTGTPSEIAPPTKCSLFKIGDRWFATLRDEDKKSKETGRYDLVRIEVSDDRIVAEALKSEWLIENAQSVPGLVVEKGKVLTTARLTGTSKELAEFLKTHGNTDAAFDRELPFILLRMK